MSELLSWTNGFASVRTDGVLFEIEKVEGRRASGVGVVVLLENQLVEPIRVEFSLDQAGKSISSGWIGFGDSARPAAPFECGRKKLVKEIRSNPDIAYAWKLELHRDSRGWRQLRPSPNRK